MKKIISIALVAVLLLVGGVVRGQGRLRIATMNAGPLSYNNLLTKIEDIKKMVKDDSIDILFIQEIQPLNSDFTNKDESELIKTVFSDNFNDYFYRQECHVVDDNRPYLNVSSKGECYGALVKKEIINANEEYIKSAILDVKTTRPPQELTLLNINILDSYEQLRGKIDKLTFYNFHAKAVAKKGNPKHVDDIYTQAKDLNNIITLIKPTSYDNPGQDRILVGDFNDKYFSNIDYTSNLKSDYTIHNENYDGFIINNKSGATSDNNFSDALFPNGPKPIEEFTKLTDIKGYHRPIYIDLLLPKTHVYSANSGVRFYFPDKVTKFVNPSKFISRGFVDPKSPYTFSKLNTNLEKINLYKTDKPYFFGTLTNR